MNAPRRCLDARQRGVASLIVVMVLLFVVALVAAYTSRNLVFETRTAANQYRSTQAIEAAEAGLEWALSMLNQGRIDASCQPTASTSSNSFRQRYLSVSATTGAVTPLPAAQSGPAYPTCVAAGGGTTNWNCSCPSTVAPTPTAPTDNAVHPAFRVHFSTVTAAPGLVRIDVNGCTSLNESCLAFPVATAVTDEARASVSALVGLASGLAAVPSATLTAGGTVNASNNLGLSIYNSDPRGSGITIQARGAVNQTTLHLVSAPGTPSSASTVIDSDGTLPDNAAQMFSGSFAMMTDTYRQQPSAVPLSCGGACNAASLRTAISLHPGQVFWIGGNLNLDTAGDIGSAAAPVALIVTGNVNVIDPNVDVYGVIYTQGTTWSGAGRLHGALIVEGALDGSGTTAMNYDVDVLNSVHFATGSFVRVPGGWKDFCASSPTPTSTNACP